MGRAVAQTVARRLGRSLLELGVSENKEDHTGIIILDDDAPVGMPLADYMGAAYLTAGELVRCNLAPYPNISRWLKNMKDRKNWTKVNQPFYDLQASLKDMPLQAI